jgi:hypothetical protein
MKATAAVPAAARSDGLAKPKRMRRRAFHLATPSGEAGARWRVIGAAVPKCIPAFLSGHHGPWSRSPMSRGANDRDNRAIDFALLAANDMTVRRVSVSLFR